MTNMLEKHTQFYLSSERNNPINPQDRDWTSSGNVVKTEKTLIVKNRFFTDDNETGLLRGQKFGRTAVSTLVTGSIYSVASSDYLVGITSLSYAPSIGLPLPSLAGAGKTFIVKDEVGGASTTTITIRSEGEKTIDGSSTSTLTTNYSAKQFYTDGANWFTI